MRLTSPIVLAIATLVDIIGHQEANAVEFFCTTVQELRDAMIEVQAGDEIVLAKGVIFTATDSVPGDRIGAHFSSDIDGTEDQRIIMRSESPSDPATLSGSNVAKKHVMRLFGDYWTIRDIIFTKAQKGIVLDHADNVHIIGCEVHYIGMEAIHVRDGSQNALIEGCFVHDTGNANPSFGEGIYVGSANKAWSDFNPHVNGTIARGCVIGPQVRAEPFDIKEGTAETLIEHNVVDALGISGANYADSFVDLKGTRTYVRYNVFHRNGAEKLKKAIAIVWRPVPEGDMSTYEHTIHDNIFHLDDSGIDMIHAYGSNFRDIYAFNNLPLDGEIADGIYQICCPPWYDPPRNETIVCVPPVGYFSSDITNTSATLSWTGYAASFTIRYNEVGSSLTQEVSTIDSSYLLDGLDYNVTYEWKVKSNCADSSSNFTDLDYFTTGQSDGGPPPYSEGAEIIYDENLRDFWNDYSFGAEADLGYSGDSRYGSLSIKCNYGSYGGLNLKRSTPLDAGNFTHFRFWASGDSTSNGAGQVGLRLKINNVRFDFNVRNDAWQNYQFSLDDFKNPDSIDNIVIQSDVGSDRVVLFDQIELITDQEPMPPTLLPSEQPVAILPTSIPSVSPTETYLPPNVLPSVTPSQSPISVPTGTPSLIPSKHPVVIVPTSSPSVLPSKTLSSSPSSLPTFTPSTSPSRFSSSNPSSAPQGPGSCVPPCVKIYDEILDSSWTAEYSFKCEYNLAFQEFPKVESNSIEVTYRKYGALYLKHSGLSTDSLQFIQFWMKGKNEGYDVRVKINGKRFTIQTSKTWRLVKIPLAEFSNPTKIKKIYFQNASKKSRTIYFDEILLL